MKILMLYPECPGTFWSNKYLLKLFKKKGNMPPLGLLTVAGLIPDTIEKKVLDLNYATLTDEDIKWADYIFVSAMIVQQDSSKEVIQRCHRLGAKIVAGGPLFAAMHQNYPEVDHFILGEGEHTVIEFIEDAKNGTLKKFYESKERPDITKSPIPRYDLIDMNQYLQVALQFCRGCPYDCEFCEITSSNGRNPRCKDTEQVIAELDYLKKLGWRGRVFFVDDNFIGNKEKAKSLLKRLVEWKKENNFEALFFTELPINAADDDELLELLRDAGFYMVFIGIETPSIESLKECGKHQNQNRNILESVKKFYQYGIKVSGGFIVGFDNDDEAIFERQLNFIQKAGIPIAMIGMLNALPNTKLKERLKQEGRLKDVSPGSNTDFFTNIEPKMGSEKLINGYIKLMKTAYSPKMYYERILNLVRNYNPVIKLEMRRSYLFAGFLTVLQLGFLTEDRFYFWKFFLTSLIKYPKSLFWGVESAVSYVHFYQMYKQMLATTK